MATTIGDIIQAMRIRFLGQPFKQQPNLMDFIEHVRDSEFSELKIAVAWAKRSGLGRIWEAVSKFRDNGGRVTLILGVSEGGATKEGLELAMEIADAAYVFHDPRRTFHPKVYFASSAKAWSLLIGSSNLTAGGLSWNYEASTWVDWDSGEGEDITDSVVAWFNDLIAEPSTCKALTPELIEQIEQSGDIVLDSESRSRRIQKKRSDTPEDNDSSVSVTISGLFKPVVNGLRKLPSLDGRFLSPKTPTEPRSSVQRDLRSADRSGTPKRPASDGSAHNTGHFVQRRWVKQLDNTAAQQAKSAKSNPTGNLRLSQEGAAIDHKHYFRDDFFEGLSWAPTEGKETEQEVVVGFHTWIDGDDLGVQELRISHDPHRVAGQGNVPTVLHWGKLGKILRETNYVGQYVSLERTDDGEFNLIISEEPRGGQRP